MRWEGNWTETGAKWAGGTGFSNQLYWLFARQPIIGQGNSGKASIKALLDFAIYLEDVNMYNYALNAYFNDLCRGPNGNFNQKTCQSSESGRDKSHVQSGQGWAALAARTLQTQGVDAWSAINNMLLRASEYPGTYKLSHTVDYDPQFARCEAVLVNGSWKEIAPYDRCNLPSPLAIWDLIYYKYVVERQEKAPWITKVKEYESRGG